MIRTALRTATTSLRTPQLAVKAGSIRMSSSKPGEAQCSRPSKHNDLTQPRALEQDVCAA